MGVGIELIGKRSKSWTVVLTLSYKLTPPGDEVSNPIESDKLIGSFVTYP